MEAPYTISTLPRPLDSTRGRIQAAAVHGFRRSRKRKRHEVAVAIDGESVNVYNIQSQRLVTSYALPPQTYLSCPPCSVYVRATPNSAAQRNTYIVARDGPDDRKRRLVCYAENARNKKTVDNDFSAPEKKECKLSDGDIASLDVVSSETDEGQHVIVTYTTGETFSISGDLAKVEHNERPSGENEGRYEVEHAATLDAEAVRKGLLRNREDVVASLDQMGADFALQYRVVRTNHERRFELYSLSDRKPNSLQTSKPGMSPLMSYELPRSRKQKPHLLHYELHAASGMLYQLLDDKLNIYDLSGTIPKLVTRLGGRSSPISSFARLSSTSVVAVSDETATIYETNYGSVQGSVSLTATTPGTQSKKRKRNEQKEQPIPFTLVSSFSELGLVVGLFGSELKALQLDNPLQSRNRRKSERTLLANVIGKGGLKETQDLRKSKKLAKKWDEWTAKVDGLIEAEDMEGLEKLVANDRKLGKQQKDEIPYNVGDEDDESDGDRAELEKLEMAFWPLPETFDPQDVDRRKVLYILGKMFTQSEAEDSGLELAIPSWKLLEWLALTGFLSSAYVQKALRSLETATAEMSVQPGGIMPAVRQIDPDFQTMHELLELPVHWEVEEVVQALRLIVKSFDPQPSLEMPLALPASPQLNGDTTMTNGDADSQIGLESRIAENELDQAMDALTTELEVRSDTLRVVFARLHAFHQPLVTSTMRALMSHRDLVYFIYILRIELMEGGWTSKYVNTGEGEEAEEGMVNRLSGLEEGGPNDEAIGVLGDLLNCAVDAIGVSGWLVGLGSAALGTRELLESLRAEASAALEGCQEANMLQSYLGEIERFVASTEQAQPHAEQHALEGIDDEENTLLPVGGRTAPPVTNGRNDKSGKKSKLALARERSRAVGKYSFDRIRI